MPRTSSLGDIHLATTRRPADVIVNVEDVVQTERGCREHAVSILTCVILVGCGIGIGVWASL